MASSSQFLPATPRRSARLLKKHSRVEAPGAPLRARSHDSRRPRPHVCKRLFADEHDVENAAGAAADEDDVLHASKGWCYGCCYLCGRATAGLYAYAHGDDVYLLCHGCLIGETGAPRSALVLSTTMLRPWNLCFATHTC